MVRANAFIAVCCCDPESCTCTVKLAVAAAPVGVPVIAPVLGFRFKPAGKDPEMTVQFTYGAVPFDAPSPCVYDAPIMPAGSGDEVLMMSAGSTVSENVREAVV